MDKLDTIVADFAGRLESLFLEHVGAALESALGHANVTLGAQADRTSRPRPKASTRGIKPCKVPKCGQPSKGPRYHFLCEKHRALSAKKIAQLLKVPKTSRKVARPAGKKGR